MLSRQAKFWIQAGAVLAGLAVVTGAFAAHGLEDYLLTLYDGVTKDVLGEKVSGANKYLGDFKTAAEYQMYHALALITLGLLPAVASPRLIRVAGWSFLSGIVLFSGSLYALVLSGQTKLGMITPIGGLLFIIGWGCMALAMLRIQETNGEQVVHHTSRN